MSFQSLMKTIFFLFLLSVIYFACGEEARPEAFLSKSPLIPKPNSVKETGSSFLIKSNMSLNYLKGDPEIERVAKQISEEWKKVTGKNIALDGDGKNGGMVLASMPNEDGRKKKEERRKKKEERRKKNRLFIALRFFRAAY